MANQVQDSDIINIIKSYSQITSIATTEINYEPLGTESWGKIPYPSKGLPSMVELYANKFQIIKGNKNLLGDILQLYHSKGKIEGDYLFLPFILEEGETNLDSSSAKETIIGNINTLKRIVELINKHSN